MRVNAAILHSTHLKTLIFIRSSFSQEQWDYVSGKSYFSPVGFIWLHSSFRFTLNQHFSLFFTCCTDWGLLFYLGMNIYWHFSFIYIYFFYIIHFYYTFTLIAFCIYQSRLHVFFFFFLQIERSTQYRLSVHTTGFFQLILFYSPFTFTLNLDF